MKRTIHDSYNKAHFYYSLFTEGLIDYDEFVQIINQAINTALLDKNLQWFVIYNLECLRIFTFLVNEHVATYSNHQYNYNHIY